VTALQGGGVDAHDDLGVARRAQRHRHHLAGHLHPAGGGSVAACVGVVPAGQPDQTVRGVGLQRFAPPVGSGVVERGVTKRAHGGQQFGAVVGGEAERPGERPVHLHPMTEIPLASHSRVAGFLVLTRRSCAARRVAQLVERPRLRHRQQLVFDPRVIERTVGDVTGLGRGDLPRPQRLVGVGQLRQRLDGGQRPGRVAHRRTRHVGQPFGRRTLPAGSQRAAVGHPGGQQRFARGRQTFDLGQLTHQP
jgi:hypothetical protein